MVLVWQYERELFFFFCIGWNKRFIARYLCKGRNYIKHRRMRRTRVAFRYGSNRPSERCR